jgi:hypothetical protein
MNYVKLIVAAAIVVSAYGFGHSVATDKGEAKLKSAEADFWKEKQTWANERAELNNVALENLTRAKKEADQKEQELRMGFTNAEKKYQRRIKGLENAQNEANKRINDVSPTGGLWASIDAASCFTPGNGSNSANVPKTPGSSSGSAEPLQCRLTTTFAQALVKIATDADKQTELLNKCIDSLAVPPSVLNPLKPDSTEKPKVPENKSSELTKLASLTNLNSSSKSAKSEKSAKSK